MSESNPTPKSMVFFKKVSIKGLDPLMNEARIFSWKMAKKGASKKDTNALAGTGLPTNLEAAFKTIAAGTGEMPEGLIKPGDSSVSWVDATDPADLMYFEIPELVAKGSDPETDENLYRNGHPGATFEFGTVAVYHKSYNTVRVCHAKKAFDFGQAMNEYRRKLKSEGKSMNDTLNSDGELSRECPGTIQLAVALGKGATAEMTCVVASAGFEKLVMLLGVHRADLQGAYLKDRYPLTAKCLGEKLLGDLWSELRKKWLNKDNQDPKVTEQLTKLICTNLSHFMTSLRSKSAKVCRSRDAVFYRLCNDTFNQYHALKGDFHTAKWEESDVAGEVAVAKEKEHSGEKMLERLATLNAAIDHGTGTAADVCAMAKTTYNTVAPAVASWGSPKALKLFGMVSSLLSGTIVSTIVTAFPFGQTLLGGICKLMDMFQAVDDMAAECERILEKIFALFQVLKDEKLRKYIVKNPPCMDKFRDIYVAIEDLTDFIDEYKARHGAIKFVIAGAKREELSGLYTAMTEQVNELHQFCSLHSIAQQDEMLHDLQLSGEERDKKMKENFENLNERMEAQQRLLMVRLDALGDQAEANAKLAADAKANPDNKPLGELTNQGLKVIPLEEYKAQVTELEEKMETALTKVGAEMKADIAKLEVTANDTKNAVEVNAAALKQQMCELNSVVSDQVLTALDVAADDRLEIMAKLEMTEEQLDTISKAVGANTDQLKNIVHLMHKTDAKADEIMEKQAKYHDAEQAEHKRTQKAMDEAVNSIKSTINRQSEENRKTFQMAIDGHERENQRRDKHDAANLKRIADLEAQLKEAQKRKQDGSSGGNNNMGGYGFNPGGYVPLVPLGWGSPYLGLGSPTTQFGSGNSFGSPVRRPPQKQTLKTKDFTVSSTKLGTGGFGPAYKCTYQKIMYDMSGSTCLVDTDAVIKTRPKEMDDALVEEYDLLVNKINHPHVLKVLHIDAGKIDDHDGPGPPTAKVFLEWCPGGSVDDALAKLNEDILSKVVLNEKGYILPEDAAKFRGLPEEVIKVYLCQTLEGLAEIHSFKVLHREVKPKNMMIGAHGEIKLADAYHLTSKDAPMRQIQSSYYMSHDSLFAGNFSEGTDLWALGCSVCEMATGRRPWSKDVGLKGSKSDGQKVMKHIYANPTAHPEVPGHLSAPLRRIVTELFRSKLDEGKVDDKRGGQSQQAKGATTAFRFLQDEYFRGHKSEGGV